MALVTMLVSMAGAYESYIPGDVVEVSDEIAQAWAEAQIAEIYVEEPKKTKKFEQIEPPAEPNESVGGDVDGSEADNNSGADTADTGGSEDVSKA